MANSDYHFCDYKCDNRDYMDWPVGDTHNRCIEWGYSCMMKEKQMNQIKINGIYKHFKGDYYLLVDVAKHSETGEDYVVYRKLYEDCALWVRPLDMFLEEVDHEKYPEVDQKYRFQLQNVKSARG